MTSRTPAKNQAAASPAKNQAAVSPAKNQASVSPAKTEPAPSTSGLYCLYLVSSGYMQLVVVICS